MHHVVKCDDLYFESVLDGGKTFEIRFNDRGYMTGDTIEQHEWNSIDGYSGRTCTHRIGYITGYEQKPGYVVFSLLKQQYGDK